MNITLEEWIYDNAISEDIWIVVKDDITGRILYDGAVGELISDYYLIENACPVNYIWTNTDMLLVFVR